MQLLHPRWDDDPPGVGRRGRWFTLQYRIAEGGFGVVYRGRDRNGVLAAIKILQNDDDGRHAERKARFEREVAFLKDLRHPRVPELIESHLGMGAKWLAVRYVPGPTLHDLVRRHRPLPAAAVVWIGADLADTLVRVHDLGVHRDVKPPNVLITLDGAELIDFGLAHLHHAVPITRYDEVVGTWAYMPDERILPTALPGNREDPVDVFGVGGVMLYALTGRAPYPSGRRPPGMQIDLSGVPADLRDIVGACLSRAAARPTAVELAAALRPPGASFRAVLPPHIVEDLARPTADTTTGPRPTRGQTRPSTPGPSRPATARLPRRRAETEDPLSGHPAIRWVRQVGDWVRAIDELPGVGLIVVTVEGRVVALDRQDGSPLWEQPLPSPATALVIAGGLVRVGAADGNVHTFTATGDRGPTTPIGGRVTAAVGHGPGLVAAGGDGVVVWLDPHLGPRWRRSLPPTVPDGLVATGDRAYAVGIDGAVRVLDAAYEGRTVGEPARIERRIAGLVHAARGEGALVTTIDGERILVGPDGSIRVPRGPAGPPGPIAACRADGRVAVTVAANGSLVAEDLTNGHIMFTARARGPLRRSLCVGRGIAVVGTVAGALDVCDLQGGEMVRQLLPGRGSALEAPAALTGTRDVAAGWADGTVALIAT